MIDEGLPCSGTDLAMQRFANYRGHVDWKQHSVYMKVQICRAFRRDNGRACALYAARIGNVLLVGENLADIKFDVKTVMRWPTSP